MFRELRRLEDGAGCIGTPAALALHQVIGHDTCASTGSSARAFEAQVPGIRARIESRRGRADPAPELTENTGGRRWLKHMGMMLGLGVAALSLWPDFSQVEAAATLPADRTVHDEFRSQMIMPLALGADSGRRMGATAAVRPLSGVPERPSLQLVATFGQGDTLARMLTRAGLGSADVARVGALVGSTMPAGQIAPGTQFDISLGRRPQPGAARTLESINFRARFDLDLSVERRGGALALIRQPIVVDETPLRIRGLVGSSLYRSARSAGAPVAAIQSYLRAIDPHVSIESDLGPGDAFDIVIAYKRSAKGERKLGELLYAGLERDGRPRLQLLRWGKSGTMIPAAGLGRTEVRTIGAPVAGRVTSLFGRRRHPILGFVRMHAGVDYGASYGSPIYAVADGLVSFAGRHGGHGNYVRLEHGGGSGTGYGHMSRIAVGPGTRVRAGQVIGYVGSTGLSTGPHLHFEAYQGGRTVNPLSMRFVSRPQIDGRELVAYRQQLAGILAIRPGAALDNLAPVPVATEHGPTREIDRIAAGDLPARN